jgi:hypothetical protein
MIASLARTYTACIENEKKVSVERTNFFLLVCAKHEHSTSLANGVDKLRSQANFKEFFFMLYKGTS